MAAYGWLLNGDKHLFTLLPGTMIKPYSIFEVTKPITVEVGTVKPWFGEVGMGTQYKLMNGSTVESLLGDYLNPVYRGKYGK